MNLSSQCVSRQRWKQPGRDGAVHMLASSLDTEDAFVATGSRDPLSSLVGTGQVDSLAPPPLG